MNCDVTILLNFVLLLPKYTKRVENKQSHLGIASRWLRRCYYINKCNLRLYQIIVASSLDDGLHLGGGAIAVTGDDDVHATERTVAHLSSHVNVVAALDDLAVLSSNALDASGVVNVDVELSILGLALLGNTSNHYSTALVNLGVDVEHATVVNRQVKTFGLDVA